ncbi:MAG: hypothetical protein NC120_10230, partial [Ruminococcus sp.]|nr:hypothetical protein [Ruminococcus sp.]
MFNAFKDFMKRDEPKKEGDEKKSKKGTVILLIFVGLSLFNIIVRFISGGDEYRNEMLSYIRENFH